MVDTVKFSEFTVSPETEIQDADNIVGIHDFGSGDDNAKFTGVQLKATAASAAPVQSVNAATGAVVLDTDDVSEGATNLYYTDARASAAAPVQSVNSATGDVVLDTDDISEGVTNLYYTDARASAAAPVQSVNSATGDVVLDTDDINEGAANLYYTDARVATAVAAAAPYDNGASGTFDYTNGAYQETTLTSASTVISVTNMTIGSIMVIEIYDGDTYAPDISGITPLRDGIPIEIDAVTRIIAERFGDGTVRYSAGGSWSA